ncbi:MAG: hypothetical protein JWM57_3085 [Phycisphaerales bacterium]|nr:hypothetical protein [Phycisphaerales bacterium]
MNVIQVQIQIVLIANRVFPEPALPDIAFPPTCARRRRVGTAHHLRPGERPREQRFEPADAGGEIRIAVGKFPQQVQVIRQHDRGQHSERPLAFSSLQR